MGAAATQRAGQQVWAVVELARGGEDALLGGLGDGLGGGRSVEHTGDRGGGEADPFGDHLQTDALMVRVVFYGSRHQRSLPQSGVLRLDRAQIKSLIGKGEATLIVES